tara:strand:+ start:303 stop:467 length:165 start_codon:yes stop_codon:yes gene_type:complete
MQDTSIGGRREKYSMNFLGFLVKELVISTDNLEKDIILGKIVATYSVFVFGPVM